MRFNSAYESIFSSFPRFVGVCIRWGLKLHAEKRLFIWAARFQSNLFL